MVLVGCFGNLGGTTYWVIVIRPQLSRSATTIKGYTSNRTSLSVLNRPMHMSISLSAGLTRISKSVLQTSANT
jgi:hypothetical protein